MSANPYTCICLFIYLSMPVYLPTHLSPPLPTHPPAVEARDRALEDAAHLAAKLRDEILSLEGHLEQAEADIAERNTKIMILGSEINAKDAEIGDLADRLQVGGC